MVVEGSGGKAGTSSCLHTLPLPSLGNATSTQLFTKKSLDFVWLVTYGHHCKAGQQTHHPCFHVFLMEERVMTFVDHCTSL